MGSVITAANVEQIAGLNTLARIHYQPGGLNPVIFVLDGKLDVGFITTTNKGYMNIYVLKAHAVALELKKSNSIVE
ncbi:hypothetical protein PVK06_038234 [Gossypium arboreum]|uniref:Uncharacterized protein n=1 Tax=Gossypium arboreum TaxID=29729 RepID=A0ABR0MZM9_GOSAR|nr:hypothetical protein PVK06_038234 [Gossypium arboreum]